MRALVIGYSVTLQQDGYLDLLRAKLKGIWEIDCFAIGGANWHSTMYLLASINIDTYDQIVFEIATCSRWLGEDEVRYRNILKDILKQVRERSSARIGFLNFSRFDVDYDNDSMMRVIRSVCEEYDYKYQNVLSFEGDIKNFLYDGIHTKNSAAKIYAESALKLIQNNNGFSVKIGDSSSSFGPGYIPIEDLYCEVKSLNEFSKGGISRRYLPIYEGEVRSFELDRSLYICGFFLKIGPQVGKLIFSMKSETVFEKLVYDERSYYERFFYTFMKPLFIENGTKFQISCERVKDRPKLLKGENYCGVQSVDVVGLFVSEAKPIF